VDSDNQIFSCSTAGAVAFSRSEFDSFEKVGFGSSQTLKRSDDSIGASWPFQVVTAHGNDLSSAGSSIVYSSVNTGSAVQSGVWNSVTTSGAREVATFGPSNSGTANTTWAAGQGVLLREMLVGFKARGKVTGNYQYDVKINAKGPNNVAGLEYLIPITMTQSFVTGETSTPDLTLTVSNEIGTIALAGTAYTSKVMETQAHTIACALADTSNMITGTYEYTVSPTSNGQYETAPSSGIFYGEAPGDGLSASANTSGEFVVSAYTDNKYDDDLNDDIVYRNFTLEVKMLDAAGGAVLSSRTLKIDYRQDDQWAPNYRRLGNTTDETVNGTGDANAFSLASPYRSGEGYHCLPAVSGSFDGTSVPTDITWSKAGNTTADGRILFGMYWRPAHRENGDAPSLNASGDLTCRATFAGTPTGWQVGNAWVLGNRNSTVASASSDPNTLFAAAETDLDTDLDTLSRSNGLAGAGTFTTNQLEWTLPSTYDLSEYQLLLWEMMPSGTGFSVQTGPVGATVKAYVQSSTAPALDGVLTDANGATAEATKQTFEWTPQPGVIVAKYQVLSGGSLVDRYELSGAVPQTGATDAQSRANQLFSLRSGESWPSFSTDRTSGNQTIQLAYMLVGLQGFDGFDATNRRLHVYENNTSSNPTGSDPAMGSSSTWTYSGSNFASRTAFSAGSTTSFAASTTITIPAASVPRPTHWYSLDMTPFYTGRTSISVGGNTYDETSYKAAQFTIVTNIAKTVEGRQDRPTTVALRNTDVRPRFQMRLSAHPKNDDTSTAGTSTMGLEVRDSNDNTVTGVSIVTESNPFAAYNNDSWAAASEYTNSISGVNFSRDPGSASAFNKYATAALQFEDTYPGGYTELRVYAVSPDYANDNDDIYGGDGQGTSHGSHDHTAASFHSGGNSRWLVATFNTTGLVLAQGATPEMSAAVSRQSIGNAFQWTVQGDILRLQYAAFKGGEYKWIDGPKFDPWSGAASAGNVGAAAGNWQASSGNLATANVRSYRFSPVEYVVTVNEYTPFSVLRTNLALSDGYDVPADMIDGNNETGYPIYLNKDWAIQNLSYAGSGSAKYVFRSSSGEHFIYQTSGSFDVQFNEQWLIFNRARLMGDEQEEGGYVTDPFTDVFGIGSNFKVYKQMAFPSSFVLSSSFTTAPVPT
jgi:hypothetical protein